MFRNGLTGLQVQSQNKNREAVPNIVIVKPSIDDEHATNKQSASKECCCSAVIFVTSRKRGKGRKVAVYKSYFNVYLYQV